MKLNDIAKRLYANNKRAKIIYGFNGTGKTRLSLTFKDLVEHTSDSSVVYYNAFTEDLFYWDNDFDEGQNYKLMINPRSSFVKTIIKDQGKEHDVIRVFQDYTSSDILPQFNNEVTEVSFLLQSEESSPAIKISKGEESQFVWSIFYNLLDIIINELNLEQEDRSTAEFDKVKCIFIDDPISSLDDGKVINVAVQLANLIKTSTSELQFIITTHHALFYNAICNALNDWKQYDLAQGQEVRASVRYTFTRKDDDYQLKKQRTDSPFAYHHILVSELHRAITDGNVQKFHFNLMRNLLEKTATFLGYANWSDCIAEEEKALYARVLNIHSHSKNNEFEYREPNIQECAVLERVYQGFIDKYHLKVFEK
ncbi:AAA family ATPase [Streptococcus sp. H31]|uniref:AAA family ATPase n=1 Tax=Streptococcus huangxiaojuni TaxID=3237239 RepID=UPI0034A24F5E